MQTSQEKTSPEYWTSFWKNYQLPAPINVNDKSPGNYAIRCYDRLFRNTFSSIETGKSKILELGCGNSTFLTYFHNEFGFEITGIDYSELGCEQTRKILERDKVKGTIIHGDIFNPLQELLQSFDVVCSFGVAEHFDDTAKAIESFSKFVKPGGLLITTIPNMAGLTGSLQKLYYKSVYDVHKILTRDAFANEIKKAGLNLLYCEYFIPVSFGLTLEPIDNKPLQFGALKRLSIKPLQVLEKLIWVMDEKIIPVKSTGFLAGGVYSVAKVGS